MGLAETKFGSALAQTYPIGREECHPGHHPSSLACSQGERLLDPKVIHDLQCHNGRIPVGKMFGGTTGRAMTQWLDGQEVHRISQLLIIELVMVERNSHAHRVDEDAGRLGGIVVIIGESIAGLDTAQVGNLDSLCSRHSENISVDSVN